MDFLNATELSDGQASRSPRGWKRWLDARAVGAHDGSAVPSCRRNGSALL